MNRNRRGHINLCPLRRQCFVLLLTLSAFVFCADGFCQSGPAPSQKEFDRMLPSPADSEVPVYLYFADTDNNYLISEARNIQGKSHPEAYCRHILQALIAGSANDLTRTIPEGTQLRALYWTPDHTVYADLSGAVSGNHPGGVRSELMTVYSIVNTLILNVSAVNRVKLLIDGREADTLAGHIDIRYPLKADMLLVR